jgi:hypothetical protein
MSFTGLAGLGGIGFVLVGIAINIVYVRARLPLPMSGRSLDEVTDDFATVGDALKRPSVLAPATWLFLTLFAAGLLAVLWRDGPGIDHTGHAVARRDASGHVTVTVQLNAPQRTP